MITAKVTCYKKDESGEGDNRQAVVSFSADYGDDRNKEWSRYTPHLALTMTLKGGVGDRFKQGGSYTLTFQEEPS